MALVFSETFYGALCNMGGDYCGNNIRQHAHSVTAFTYADVGANGMVQAVNARGQKVETTWGRFARACMADVTAARPWIAAVLDSTVERSVNLWKTVTTPATLEFWHGPKLKRAWLTHNAAPTAAGIRQSCMRYPRKQPYLNFYSRNPRVCRVAVHLNAAGKVQARALVWLDIYGQVWYDRVYGNDASMAGLSRALDNLGIRSLWRAGHREVVNVRMDKLIFPTYPYLDSLVYINWRTKYLSNTRDSGPYSSLTSQNGGRTDGRTYGSEALITDPAPRGRGRPSGDVLQSLDTFLRKAGLSQ